MSKGVYVGVFGTARKAKKAYIGIQGTARKIKKGYIGVGGVARPFYSSSSMPTWYGTSDIASSEPLENPPAMATTQSYVFLSSYTTSGSRRVYTFNNSLVKSSVTAMAGRGNEGAASLDGKAIFGGGLLETQSSTKYYGKATAYDNNLSYSQATIHTAGGMGGGAIGNYALFVGGIGKSGSYAVSTTTANAVTSSMTVTTPTKLSAARHFIASTNVGNYLVFAGGIKTQMETSTTTYDTVTANVDAYDMSLVKSTPTDLSEARYKIAAASVGNYALFAGGNTSASSSSSSSSNIDVYDTNLTKGTTLYLPTGRVGLGGASTETYAMFVGGKGAADCDLYDSNLVRQSGESITTAAPVSGIAFKDWALFASATTLNAYSI